MSRGSSLIGWIVIANVGLAIGSLHENGAPNKIAVCFVISGEATMPNSTPPSLAAHDTLFPKALFVRISRLYGENYAAQGVVLLFLPYSDS